MLKIEFTDDNTAVILTEEILSEEGPEPCIEIRFQGAAQNLTSRAKCKIVMEVMKTYQTEHSRLTYGHLEYNEEWTDNGTLQRVWEERPTQPTM